MNRTPTTLWLIWIALLFSVRAHAAEAVASPDGRFAVQGGSSVDVVNAEGQNEIRLVDHLAGAQRVEVKWSGDSKRVAVAVNFRRGSGIFVAWNDGSAWHKTLQTDEIPVTQLSGAAGLSGRVVAEQRTLGEWTSPDALTVRGELTVSGGQTVAYAYTLGFVAGTGTRDRGGYEEGVLRVTNYQVTLR